VRRHLRLIGLALALVVVVSSTAARAPIVLVAAVGILPVALILRRERRNRSSLVAWIVPLVVSAGRSPAFRAVALDASTA
jgi:hypothetical protein